MKKKNAYRVLWFLLLIHIGNKTRVVRALVLKKNVILDVKGTNSHVLVLHFLGNKTETTTTQNDFAIVNSRVDACGFSKDRNPTRNILLKIKFRLP